MAYTYLLFDLDRTLLDFASAEDVALTQLFSAEGVSQDDMAAYKAYYVPMNEGLWKALERQEISKDELVNTRFARAFAHFGVEKDGPTLAKRYAKLLSQQGQTFPGAWEMLDVLTDRGYDLYAITNGLSDIQRGRLAGTSLAVYFNDVFISEEMGVQKPDPAYFDQVAAAIPGFKKSETLVIGDSLTSDIQGAVNSGLDSLWYNPAGLDLPAGAAQPTAVVADYDAILDYLPPRKDY